MAGSRRARIARELMSEPHVEGRRISVLHVHDHVEERGLSPLTVADRFGLDVADVYHALAYYHDHPGEMKSLREERERVLEDVRERIERPDDVDPNSE